MHSRACVRVHSALLALDIDEELPSTLLLLNKALIFILFGIFDFKIPEDDFVEVEQIMQDDYFG